MPKVTKICANNEIEQHEKIRCAAYCRVSSSSEDQLNSYASQIRYYSGIFDNSETEELVDVYADEGITGTSAEKRDEFKRLISDCKKGKIDRIYTKSISRYARNTKECLESIRLLKALGVTIFFEKENIDTAKMSDEMMITIMGGLAQEESTSISQNQKWSVRKRMQNGTYISSSVAYGYRSDNGNLIIDEQKAKVVRQIFKWYLSGEGVTAICSKLNKMKVPTCMYGKAWGNFAVTYILTNEIYIGNMVMQKTYSTDTIPIHKKINKGEKEKYLIKNNHSAIIDIEDFRKVQEILNIRAKQYYRAAGEKTTLSGIIICSCCKGTYKRKQINRKTYWVCRNHDLLSTSCSSKAISEEIITQAFISMCNKLILHYKDILLPLQRGLTELNTLKFKGNHKVLDIHREIASLKEQRHVIARLRKKGFLDEQKYNEQLASLEIKIKRQEKELKKISNLVDNDEMSDQIDMLIRCVEKKKSTLAEFDKEMFEEIVDSITVNEHYIDFMVISGLRFTEKIYM